ncbi:host cell factor 1-like [Planococcus citri]|uniref:host cell factor 1-like n=1 Tax=Planococcus citri TaxID=170843 RepID=UPI0031FA01A3
MDTKEEANGNDAFNDALITLASAALTRDSMPVVKKEIPTPQPPSSGTPSPIEEPPWHDVGIFSATSCMVNRFFVSDRTNDHATTTSENLPDYSNLGVMELLPGTAYKFRVAAVNSCGRGEWSDVSAFKTCLLGFPGAPCQIKISRTAEGARLQWEPPTLISGEILEYSVCLAVKSSQNSGTVPLKDLPFKRVYCGIENQAFVDNQSLTAAHVDVTTKPAIIFRIAARNEKGYGPATQVRWLQDMSPSKNHNEHSKKDANRKKLSKLRVPS